MFGKISFLLEPGGAGAGRPGVRRGREGAGRDAEGGERGPPPVVAATCEPFTSSAASAAAEAKLSVSAFSPGGALSWRFIGRAPIKPTVEDDVVVVGVEEPLLLLFAIPPRPVPAKRAGASSKTNASLAVLYFFLC